MMLSHVLAVLLCVQASRPQKHSDSVESSSTSSTSPSFIRLVNQNLLGEAYNPLEFMQTNDEFQNAYADIERSFMRVTTEAVMKTFRLITHDMDESGIWEPSERMKKIDNWTSTDFSNTTMFYDYVRVKARGEPFLKMDNNDACPKTGRTNLIVGGTASNLRLGSWRDRMIGQGALYSKAGPELLAWDIACNLAAEGAPLSYESLITTSYLNQARAQSTLTNFMEQAVRGIGDAVGWKTPRRSWRSAFEQMQGSWRRLIGRLTKAVETPDAVLLMGVEEFPETGHRRIALESVLKYAKMKFIPPQGHDSSVGLIYSSNLREPTSIRSAPFGQEFQEVIKQLSLDDPAFTAERITNQISAMEEKTAKSVKGSLATTGRKTMVVDFEAQDLRIVVVHAKDLKVAYGYELMARYVKALAVLPLKSGSPFNGMTAVLTDANTPSKVTRDTFIEALERLQFQVMPKGVNTTQKERSLLHGQIYDLAKAKKLVAEQKDYIAVFQPQSQPLYTLNPPADGVVFPDLSITPDNPEVVRLPNDEWASDHSQVRIDLIKQVPGLVQQPSAAAIDPVASPVVEETVKQSAATIAPAASQVVEETAKPSAATIDPAASQVVEETATVSA